MKKTKQLADDDFILRKLRMMNHKDLQRGCVARGLEFENVVGYDHWGLANWLYKNFDRSEDPKLLQEYDSWQDAELVKRGYKKGDAVFSPSLRLGFTPELDKIKEPKNISAEGTVKPTKSIEHKVAVENKPKRQMDETLGIYKGTKKALTYELTKAGFDIGEIIEKVKQKFPEAQDKSIKIWSKRAQKGE